MFLKKTPPPVYQPFLSKKMETKQALSPFFLVLFFFILFFLPNNYFDWGNFGQLIQLKNLREIGLFPKSWS
ncbi:MAG: hypothetical protein RL757_2488 [Bacteroidota bacterium]